MKTPWLNTFALFAAVAAALAVAGNTDHDRSNRLLNVSYDPTRELERNPRSPVLAEWSMGGSMRKVWYGAMKPHEIALARTSATRAGFAGYREGLNH